jgi:hypothetical protein
MSANLSPEGLKTLERVLGWLAPALRQKQGQRMTWLAGLIASDRGLAEADPACVIQAAEFVLNPGFRPLFASLKGTIDRAAAKLLYENKEVYYSTPRPVMRWDIAAGKPAKPAAEMKVVAFTASSRKGSNSSALVAEALRGAASLGAATEQVDLADSPLSPCVSNMIQRDFFAARELVPGMELEYCRLSRDCRDAAHKGTCARDDQMDGYYRKIMAADAIVIGFPIYNGWEPAVLFNFMERWARHESCLYGSMKPGRRGMLVGTWGFNDPGCYDHVLDALTQKLNFRQVEVVEVIAACNVAGMFSALDEKGGPIIRHFPAEMSKAFEAGKTLVSGTRQ